LRCVGEARLEARLFWLTRHARLGTEVALVQWPLRGVLNQRGGGRRRGGAVCAQPQAARWPLRALRIHITLDDTRTRVITAKAGGRTSQQPCAHPPDALRRTYGGGLAHVDFIILHITTIPELFKLNIYLRARLPYRPAARINVGAVRNPPRSNVLLRRTAVARRRA
jgi:hypothetical protein